MDASGVSPRPLAGLRVVEAATYISGPLAAMALGQLGAEVVKVETPEGGDPARRFGLRHEGLSALWVNLNHGKRSVTLDLKRPAGRDQLLGLLRDADVFMQNWRPGVAARLGLTADDAQAVNPRLIYLAITGFGETGPYAGMPCYDSLIQAVSGLMAAESADHHPAQLRSYIADKITAMTAVQLVLSALLERARTGRGRRIDLPMLDAMAYFNFPDLGQDRTFLAADNQLTLVRNRSCCVRTSDGYVALAPVAGRQIRAAVAAVGHPEWIDELKRASPVDLTQLLFDKLEEVMPTRDTEHWLREFAKRDVPAAPVPDLAAHFADPQVTHNAIYDTRASSIGPVRTVRYPGRLDGSRLDTVPVAPITLGGSAEHWEQVS